jgi:hypothetical protein
MIPTMADVLTDLVNVHCDAVDPARVTGYISHKCLLPEKTLLAKPVDGVVTVLGV